MNLMRLLKTIQKSLLENLRDYKILVFVLVFAPLFMFVLRGMYSDSEAVYKVAVLLQPGDVAAERFVETLGNVRYDSGKAMYQLAQYKMTVENQGSTFENAVREGLEKRRFDAGLVLEPGMTEHLVRLAQQPGKAQIPIKLLGDTNNPRYSLAAIYLLADFEDFIRTETGLQPAYSLTEEFVGAGEALTEFDIFVPGLVAFSLLNVMFTAGASFLKEAERLTLHRLLLSRLTNLEFVMATLLVQGALCILAMTLALWSAQFNGFAFSGSYWLLVLISLLSTLAVVGVALMTVSFLKTVYDLMTIGIIPYFIVMFFSGIFFPISSPLLLQLGTLTLHLNDLLPLTLSVDAFNQVLNFGATLGELGPELIGTTAISLVYFVLGLWLFGRRHMTLQTR